MGSWPSAQAGNAIEAQIDLRERGGCVISSRRFSPAWQRVSSWAMASMCQLGLKASLGDEQGRVRARDLFVDILRRIDRLRTTPLPT